VITRELLREWDACWDDDHIADVVPPDGLTPLQVCDLDSVSSDDRLWVLLREELIPARQLRLLACLWAERALALVQLPDPRSVEAIAVARRYALGEATGRELAAARDAARDAAWAAARDAARDAAMAAAWAAARAAARAAAWAAAWAAARAAQIADVRRVLAGGDP
jgi:hypothetical protein